MADFSKKIRGDEEIYQEEGQIFVDGFNTSTNCIRDSGYSEASTRSSNGSLFSRNSVFSTASSTYRCSTYETPTLRKPSLTHDIVVHLDLSPSASLPNQSCTLNFKEYLADDSIEEEESLMCYPKKRFFSM